MNPGSASRWRASSVAHRSSKAGAPLQAHPLIVPLKAQKFAFFDTKQLVRVAGNIQDADAKQEMSMDDDPVQVAATVAAEFSGVDAENTKPK